jgi:hypothetical protein
LIRRDRKPLPFSFLLDLDDVTTGAEGDCFDDDDDDGDVCDDDGGVDFTDSPNIALRSATLPIDSATTPPDSTAAIDGRVGRNFVPHCEQNGASPRRAAPHLLQSLICGDDFFFGFYGNPTNTLDRPIIKLVTMPR